MGLNGYTPVVRITGAHADLINGRRLIDWEHIDAAGQESDRLHLTVDTRGLDGLPREGDKLGLEVGWAEGGALVNKGQFTISRTTPKLFPDQLMIVATAAPWEVADETAFKRRRSASFTDTTLGEIFRTLTRRHGFSPRIAPALDGIAIEHVDQADETDAAFLTRLAGRFDAVAKPYDGLYVMARRGETKAISGQSIPIVTLSVPPNNEPGQQAFVNASVDRNSRLRFKGVQAAWFDGEEGVEVEVDLGEEPFKRLRQSYQSPGEAQAAGEGELRRLRREAAKLRVECPGNPDLAAEGLIELDDSWPSHMQGQWSLDKVTARGSRRGGYRCSLEATWPDGKVEE
ncbi:contractile injection system protein, VgrG/Pvc8 family [Halomonas getboli]|uniref:contractile injection system protein, VgrG/Pvc8 family n=1 Tax=Halomonas getboli TaxID=2935862 RepID=UPI001FFE5809|nr:contractile injection system protein, VgrG/Pvc8 family [Halomonas getboli]MCK2185701.1 phage late control D family protein [Halomonas getboli]